MSLTHRTPKRKPTTLGYHRGCDGAVHTVVKKRFSKRFQQIRVLTYYICSACHAPVPPVDVLPEPEGFRKQQTAGVRRRNPRYTYKSWKDVK